MGRNFFSRMKDEKEVKILTNNVLSPIDCGLEIQFPIEVDYGF